MCLFHYLCYRRNYLEYFLATISFKPTYFYYHNCLKIVYGFVVGPGKSEMFPVFQRPEIF